MTATTVGYDPARLALLRHQTQRSIDALRAIWSSDPAAEPAVGAVRSMLRTLESAWMPAITAIESSGAFTGGPSFAGTTNDVDLVPLAGIRSPSSGPGRPTVDAYRELWDSVNRWLEHPKADAVADDFAAVDNEELQDRIAVLDSLVGREEPSADVDWWPAGMSLGEIERIIARELAGRVPDDPDLRQTLLNDVFFTPIVAEIVAVSTLPGTYKAEMLSMFRIDDHVLNGYEIGRRSDGLNSLLVSLARHPSITLDLLQDTDILRLIGHPDNVVDADAIEAFITAGLIDAVVDDPERHADGYGVLADLVDLTGGEFDHGIHPGVGRGVSTSMIKYVDTFAPAIRMDRTGTVEVRLWNGPTSETEITLGTYDEVSNFFGTIMRDELTQAHLGIVAGAYTHRVITDLGADLTRRFGLTHIAKFADMLHGSIGGEQEQITLAAAASQARSDELAALVGFGIGLLPAGTSARKLMKGIGKGVLSDLAGGEVDGEEMPDQDLDHQIHDEITVAVVGLFVNHPAEFARLGIDEDDELWAELVERYVTATEERLGSDERADAVGDLNGFITDWVPELEEVLTAVRKTEGVAALASS